MFLIHAFLYFHYDFVKEVWRVISPVPLLMGVEVFAMNVFDLDHAGVVKRV